VNGMAERKRTAAIISLNDDVKELEDLADSANLDVLYEVIQRRAYPDSATFVGKGKASSLEEVLEKRHVDVLLFNGNLKPSQHFNLEKNLRIECVDRVRLVLNIFKERAKTAESKLQVERATLKYEIPFLREWIHNAKAGEHPGFLAGGEYAVDVYYDLIRKRMNVIDGELSRLGRSQELRREQRRKKGFGLVCFAGYTNAGKSSLLNVLTNDTTMVDNKMFSTLSARTRRADGLHGEILLTDTIGFLENLPYFMIESFRYTIDEIFSADLILLVVDSSDSDDEMMRKINASTQILFPEVDSSRIMVILNKTDLLSSNLDEKIRLIRDVTSFNEIIPTSTISKQGIENMIRLIASHFHKSCEIDLALPNVPDTARVVAWLYDTESVRSVDYGDEVRLSIGCREESRNRIIEKVKGIGGRVIEAPGQEALSLESSSMSDLASPRDDKER
jgi:GTP-binding protein HflX